MSLGDARPPVLLDAYGTPIRRAAAASFGDTRWNGASRGNDLRDWNPLDGSPDADNMFDMGEVRARSRDLDKNEALARATFDTATVNAIGEGLMPIPQVDWRVLGRTRAWADGWNQEVRAIARDYYESTDVDASRQGGWGELQALAFRNVLMSGSVLGLLTWRPDDCIKWSTCVHLIEGDRLSNPGGIMDDRFLRGGVEIDAYGKPLAYHIQRDHPGEAFLGGQTYVWDRLPARTSWGRPRVMHVFERERPGQNYGMALIASVMPTFRMLSKYKQAEMAAAANNAIIAMTIKSPASMGELMALFKGGEGYMDARQEYNRAFRRLPNGSVVPMFPGDEMEAFDPGRPNPNAISFIETLGRDCAMAAGLPLEVISKDYARMNYSSARVALLDSLRTYASLRAWLIRRFIRPTHEAWFEEACAEGAIPDCTLDAFLANRSAWTRTKQMAPARGWVDPVKEAQASGMRVSLGLSTLEEECAEQGRDWRDVADQKAAEKEHYEQVLGMSYPGDQAPVGQKVWEDDDGDEASADGGDQQQGGKGGKGATQPAKATPRMTEPAPKPIKKAPPPKARVRRLRHAA